MPPVGEHTQTAPAFSDKEQSVDPEIVGLGYCGLAEYLRQKLRTWKSAVELSGAKVYQSAQAGSGTLDRVNLDVLRRHHLLPAVEVLR